ncbi:acyltransferase family protein [Methanobrevibacter arboriphilus]|uniref:acyltransferase family protein n=1 Tax=Methanobrevibacter arboriphilus TaxID=39441 RepID=UPI001CDB3747
MQKKSQRLFKYDNLRGFAIILVVFFHVLDSFFQFPFYRPLGQITLVIAMPLLFFISGYFSKVDENTQIKAFKGLFIPFILFCTLWIAFSFFCIWLKLT